MMMKEPKQDTLSEKTADEAAAKLLEAAGASVEVTTQYECAIMETETRLKVLNTEFSLVCGRSPLDFSGTGHESIPAMDKPPVSSEMRRKPRRRSMSLRIP